MVDGEIAWTMNHHLPPLWAWLFDPASITESRRLHNTLFQAASRFQELAVRTRSNREFGRYAALFEEIVPDRFSRELKLPPDAIITLNLADLEALRPYRHEEYAARWEAFFQACEAGENAASAWEGAIFSPIRLKGSRQHDARLLGGLAEGIGLPRADRARALVWTLFGRPQTHAARALSETWIEKAQSHPAIEYRPRITLLDWILKR